MILLGLAFACSWMVVAAMAVHLPRLLEAAGATTVQAVAAGALIGPAQVAARLAEAGVLKRFHPLVSARLSVVLHPLGAGLLAFAGPVRRRAHSLSCTGRAAAFSPLPAEQFHSPCSGRKITAIGSGSLARRRVCPWPQRR